MKKYLKMLMTALLILAVLFVAVACKEPEPEPEPVVTDPTLKEKCAPILPKGTGQVIPRNWSVDPNGVTGLPAFIVNFSGDVDTTTNVTAELKAAIANAQTSGLFNDKPVNNVIVLIGDGMGLTHLDMSRAYKGELLLDSLPYFNEAKTDCYQKPGNTLATKTTTDSPAGGTQILTGYKTRYGYISLDVNADPVKTLSEVARDRGWKRATVTNDHIADATPADDIVHNTSRYHQEVLYYQELIEDMPDLLMGWDWGMNYYFIGTGEGKNWAARMEGAEYKCVIRGIEKEISSSSSANPNQSTYKSALATKIANASNDKTQGIIAFYKSLTAAEKNKFYPYSLFYHVWENETDQSVEFETWLDSGFAAYCTAKDASYGNPESHVNRYTNFAGVIANTDYTKPILGSWTEDGSDYDTNKPNRGYWLRGAIGMAYPSYPEMVAYTLWLMDKESNAAGTGFYCMIENTCTDGWGHAQKWIGAMNEVQCFDEGVAIAVKYVLEHPDTLLVVTADHETGGFMLGNGWQDNIAKISSSTSGHSSFNVPSIAFGAGAERFSKTSIQAEFGANAAAGVEVNTTTGRLTYEGWVTGAIIGRLMGEADFGQPAGYPN